MFIVLVLLHITSLDFPGLAQETYSLSDITKVVFLGTGNPNPDPQHSGNSIAIVINNTLYIVALPFALNLALAWLVFTPANRVVRCCGVRASGIFLNSQSTLSSHSSDDDSQRSY